MGTIFFSKRASEAFSVVMKTNNCLRLRVLTRNACLHLSYVSSPGELEKWFPLRGVQAHSLKLFCMYDKRFEISKTK